MALLLLPSVALLLAASAEAFVPRSDVGAPGSITRQALARDATVSHALTLEPDDASAPASHEPEQRFSLHLAPDAFGLEQLRGQPDGEENSHRGEDLCGPKTRIGGSELFLGTRIGPEARLTLGLHWGCGLSGCGIAEEQRFDPWGLQSLGQQVAEYNRSRNDTVAALDQLKVASGATADLLDEATDLGPGIGAVKGFAYFYAAWKAGDRRTLAMYGGAVALGSAVSILARRAERLRQVSAKAVNEIDEATLAAEQRAATHLNESSNKRSRDLISQWLGASDDVSAGTRVASREGFGGLVGETSAENAFLVNARATFGEGSAFQGAVRHRGNIVIQRSDIPLSIQNLRRMNGGNPPFVRNSVGEWEAISLHHVGRQDGQLIEVLASHNAYNPSTGGPLHIPGPGGPVRQPKLAQTYWQQRLEDLIAAGQVSAENLRALGR